MRGWLTNMMLVMGVWPMAALAWNPYPDVSNPPPNEKHWSQPTPSSSQTLRMPIMRSAPGYRPPINYAAPAYTPPPPSYTPPPPSYTPPPMQAATTAPDTSLRYVPVAQHEPATPMAAPAYAAPAYVSPSPPATTMNAPSDGNYTPFPQPQYGYVPGAEKEGKTNQPGTHHWAVGIDMFADRYEEPTLGVETEGGYFSLLGEYEYYSNGMKDIYLGADLRASTGESDYESGSGTLDGIPETEYEARLKVGLSTIENGRGFVPYTGVAMRYYRMDGKGLVTNLGAGAYDRNIFQVYLPIGVNAHTTWGGWNMRGTLEYDHLLAGYVSSRLENVPAAGIENLMNHQDKGYALRAEFMMGQTYANGLGWAFGPYLRYWNVDDSDIDQYGFAGYGGMEPENKRLQYGASLKFLF